MYAAGRRDEAEAWAPHVALAHAAGFHRGLIAGALGAGLLLAVWSGTRP